MRFLGLYLRARGAPAAALALVLISAAAWLLAEAVAVADDDEATRLSIGVLAATLAVAAAATTLSGFDEALERTSGIRWPPRRVTHVVVAGVAVAVALGALALTGRPLATTALLVRDVAGLAGLAALTAVVLGSDLAWTLPAGWALTAAAMGPGKTQLSMVGTWPVQPPGTASATVTAVVLAVAGTAAYAARGCRRVNRRAVG